MLTVPVWFGPGPVATFHPLLDLGTFKFACGFHQLAQCTCYHGGHHATDIIFSKFSTINVCNLGRPSNPFTMFACRLRASLLPRICVTIRTLLLPLFFKLQASTPTSWDNGFLIAVTTIVQQSPLPQWFRALLQLINRVFSVASPSYPIIPGERYTKL